MDKKFIIFYYDTDDQGYSILGVDILQKCFNTLLKVLPPESSCIFLPNHFYHTNWLTQEEYLNILKKEIERVENPYE